MTELLPFVIKFHDTDYDGDDVYSYTSSTENLFEGEITKKVFLKSDVRNIVQYSNRKAKTYTFSKSLSGTLYEDANGSIKLLGDIRQYDDITNDFLAKELGIDKHLIISHSIVKEGDVSRTIQVSFNEETFVFLLNPLEIYQGIMCSDFRIIKNSYNYTHNDGKITLNELIIY